MVVEDFAEFFRAVNDDHPPFPWQERLVRQVAAERAWPPVIAVPTGCGKTALIDITVFLLALEADRSDRVAALRVFFAVDRRLIVDQAEERATRLAAALASAKSGILAEIASRLRSFGADPLRVAKMRGGMVYEGFWCEDPRQPTIVTTTVDQLGSRLLFRGYGCSDSRRPIEAGLIGNDSLVLVDEAHLSTPFLETLAAVKKLGADIHLVQMSATARGSDSVFCLGRDDLKDPVLSLRVKATKLARLRKCTDLVTAAVAAAVELSEKARVVGVVVNTVDNARKIFERLSCVPNAKATLLIGRVRPIDRDKVLAEWLPRIKTGRDRIDGQPVFIVATQTIEVGADIDLDALVTEAAPLDVLRQRFGRLDRLGELGKTAAVVLRTPDEFRAYGDATGKTWTWLGKRSRSRNGEKTVDFGVLAMDDYLKKHPADGAFSPASHAPPFLPAYLEAWCQTAAIPDADPAVAPFLHGPDAFDVDEVQVVWRADLEDNWLDAVMVAPPSIREAMAVPIWALRNWLGSRPVLLWCGLDSARTGMVPVKAIRPGDTVVVPSDYGGADAFGWHSDSRKPVKDIGDEVGKWVRLHPAFLTGEHAARLARIVRSEELDNGAVARLTNELGIGGINVASAQKYGSGIILFRKRQLMAEGDVGSVTSVPVPLSTHLDGVELRARQFASSCRLTIDEIEAVASAARLHDMGKLDPRFQAILHGGDLLEAYRALARGMALAKSGDAWTLADYRRQRLAAGYPVGARHEAASVSAAQCCGVSDLVLHLIAAHHGHARPSLPWWTEEPDFVIPMNIDGVEFDVSPGSALAAIDSPVIDRFWSFCSSAGYWKLAFLEAVLRLADWAQSKEGSNA